MAYGLEKIVSEETPIYQQLTNYYRFCTNRRGFSPMTMKSKTYHINRFIDFNKINNLEDVTNEHIDKWVDFLRITNSGRTINSALSCVKAMLRWERDDGMIIPHLSISRIVKHKEMPPRRMFYTREQISRALSCADRREWLMIKLCFDCGLRISELRNLRLSDIHDRKIRIVGKGQKLRYVLMSTEVRTRLDDYISKEGITDYLWESHTKRGKPISTIAIRRNMGIPFAAAGLNGFYPHALRHSYATDLKKLGLSTRQIQIGMGHSSESITERYLHDLDGFDIETIYDIKYGEPDPDLR